MAPMIDPDAPPRRGLSRRAAGLVTAMLLVLCSAAIVILTERPLLARPVQAGSVRRAAFAIRDHVIPFQQWGTRSFTLPSLQAAYGTVDYVTLRSWGEDRSDEVARRIERLLEAHDVVDLFLLAHSNPFV